MPPNNSLVIQISDDLSSKPKNQLTSSPFKRQRISSTLKNLASSNTPNSSNNADKKTELSCPICLESLDEVI